MTEERTYRVEAVNIESGAVRVLASGLSEKNADAFVTMAVVRRGVEVEFFRAVEEAK